MSRNNIKQQNRLPQKITNHKIPTLLSFWIEKVENIANQEHTIIISYSFWQKYRSKIIKTKNGNKIEK